LQNAIPSQEEHDINRDRTFVIASSDNDKWSGCCIRSSIVNFTPWSHFLDLLISQTYQFQCCTLGIVCIDSIKSIMNFILTPLFAYKTYSWQY